MGVTKRIGLGSLHAAPRRTAAPSGDQSILRTILVELASALLPRGVTSAGFTETAKHAFIEAAVSKSRFRNGRVNQSKVSVLTGLRRGEVRRLLGSANSLTQHDLIHRSPLDAVIAGWCADKRFGDKGGVPKRLRVGGSKGSFASLVRSYAGDLPPRALLDELNRLGVTHQIGRFVEVQSLAALHRRRNFASIARSMPAIIDALRLAAQSDPGPESSSIRRLVLPARNLLDLQMVSQRCTSNIDSMLDGLKASLAVRPRGSGRAKQAGHSCSVTVLFLEHRGTYSPPRRDPGRH
jgi:hypothetical protein